MNTSGGTRGGQRVVLLLGFLLLVSFPLVSAFTYTMLNSTSNRLTVDDRLVSPSEIFELVIDRYTDVNNKDMSSGFYLVIRYCAPVDQKVAYVPYRAPLSNRTVLNFSPDSTPSLTLSDNPSSNQETFWTSYNANGLADSTQLLDTGNLVLLSNQTRVWGSFNETPTNTLLPGQTMYRKKGHKLQSWRKIAVPLNGSEIAIPLNGSHQYYSFAWNGTNGDPQIDSDTYSFGWDKHNVLALSWTPGNSSLWAGGNYIPAPDVYAAHRIANVDFVYFHAQLGHLYINSMGEDFPANTAILSGGPDRVDAPNNTVLKHITLSPDGSLIIFQWIRGQSTAWEAVANWVVSDRPDSRSQCTAFGTCGDFGVCVSPVDYLGPAICTCPGPQFQQGGAGCSPPTGDVTTCTTQTGEMVTLEDVDHPWFGDYKLITTAGPNECSEACAHDCYCAGAVFSKDEGNKCWLKNGVSNLGYPSFALHGTDRTTFLKTASVPPYHPEKKSKKVKPSTVAAIVVPSVVGVAIVLILAALFRGNWRTRLPGGQEPTPQTNLEEPNFTSDENPGAPHPRASASATSSMFD